VSGVLLVICVCYLIHFHRLFGTVWSIRDLYPWICSLDEAEVGIRLYTSYTNSNSSVIRVCSTSAFDAPCGLSILVDSLVLSIVSPPIIFVLWNAQMNVCADQLVKTYKYGIQF
jgi:hypothetical protein